MSNELSQTMPFSSMAIIEPIQKALSKSGYTHPTPIQEQAIPALIEKRNLLACSQTGTGKTASFMIPTLQYLSTQPKPEPKHPRALILTPTRELAEQISKYAQSLGRFMNVSQTTVYGGVKPFNQIRSLKKGTSLLIATPGRFLDLMEQGFINLSQIGIFILDEADRMLDMGFLPDIKRIHGMLPEQHQCMLFSATMPPEIDKLSQQFLQDPVKITIAPPSTTVENIDQQVMLVDADKKLSLIQHLLEDAELSKVIVFTRTKYGAHKLSRALFGTPGRVDAIHGDKSQKARQHTLKQFTDGRLRILIATDVASRGIDIDNISHVINYELPEDPESYVHRIGRTGRAGATGTAISFCSQQEWYYLSRIEKETNQSIPVQEQPFHNDTIGPKKSSKKKRKKPSRSRTNNKPTLRSTPTDETSSSSREDNRSQSRKFSKKDDYRSNLDTIKQFENDKPRRLSAKGDKDPENGRSRKRADTTSFDDKPRYSRSKNTNDRDGFSKKFDRKERSSARDSAQKHTDGSFRHRSKDGNSEPYGKRKKFDKKDSFSAHGQSNKRFDDQKPRRTKDANRSSEFEGSRRKFSQKDRSNANREDRSSGFKGRENKRWDANKPSKRSAPVMTKTMEREEKRKALREKTLQKFAPPSKTTGASKRTFRRKAEEVEA